MDTGELIAVARGEKPADLLLTGARIINTLTGSIEEGNVALYGDKIAGVGDYSLARKTISLNGAYLAPGLINGHTHIESSMLHPVQYACAVVPRGTSTVVTDLHEITNVCGLDGIKFVMKWARKLPLDMFFMVPSCVPATHMETSGGNIEAGDIHRTLRNRNVLGLGEMMNYPGVVFGDGQVLQKLAAASGRVIDGHAPGLTGKQLQAYIAAGIGSDHESTTFAEGKEKLKLGMHLMIREGSSEKNLEELLPLVSERTYRRCLFVVDDRSCSDLLNEGDIDAVVRKAIRLGLDPVTALQLATINPAEYFRLYDRGGIAPGYKANLITITDLDNLTIDMVFQSGKLVARNGTLAVSMPAAGHELTDTMHIKPFDVGALKLGGNDESFPVIEIVPGQIITHNRNEKVRYKDGDVIPDTGKDILKLVVAERHRASGNIGIGLVKGFGLKQGALASSVAHDSHNVVAVGTGNEDIYLAIKEVERMRGGLAVCSEGTVRAVLPLPVAGLLSLEPLVEVVSQFDNVEKAAAALGNVPPAPFSILSFLALAVIPELRLTDMGLVDVLQFKIVRK